MVAEHASGEASWAESTWTSVVSSLTGDETSTTAKWTTLALGLLGLVVIGTLAQRAWTQAAIAGGEGGNPKTGTAKASRSKPVAQGKIDCKISDRERVIEATSDFLRNVRANAITIVSPKGSPQPLGDYFEELKALGDRSKSEAVSREFAVQVTLAVQNALLKAWKEGGDTASSLPGALGAQVIELLTVSPTMDALLDAGIMPPSMNQPAYTLVVTGSEVRCITEGFVGMPVMGPADPNLKYTSQRMRLLSGNIMDVATSASPSTMRLEYCIMPTSAQRISQVTSSTHTALHETCQMNSSSANWQDFLTC